MLQIYVAFWYFNCISSSLWLPKNYTEYLDVLISVIPEHLLQNQSDLPLQFFYACGIMHTQFWTDKGDISRKSQTAGYTDFGSITYHLIKGTFFFVFFLLRVIYLLQH